MLHLTNHAIHFRNQFNPIGAGGHNNVHTLFQMAISPRKKGSGGPKLCDFSEKQKKLVFTVFLGYLEGLG